MKACIIQNRYSMNPNDVESCFNELINTINNLSETCDIIVLSEDSDVPAAIKDKETYDKYSKMNLNNLLDACSNAARRCNSLVFVNAATHTEKGNINTTFVIDKNGNVIGKYLKAHPAPSEFRKPQEGGLGFDDEYTNSFNEPYTITIDGIKYAFLTCYDFYFLDYYTILARQKPDIIIGCSLQRTDAHETLETMCKNVAYYTGAYLVRASVSLSEDSEICGCSCVVSPNGKILTNMKSKVGVSYTEFDPLQKFYKAAGFGGKQLTHFEYTEQGRRPWLCNTQGPDCVQDDNRMPYPRLCAHRGFSVIAPENTIVALSSAVALDADEIEFDLWMTKDGVIVSNHDPTLSRTSNGTGNIYDHTYEELSKLDFGYKFSEGLRGLPILTFENILKKLSLKTIMNVHLKTKDDVSDVPNEFLDNVVKLIDKYSARKYLYLMITNDKLIEYARTAYPDINVCVGANWYPSPDVDTLIDRAIKYNCQKIQIFIPHYDKIGVPLASLKDKVQRAHDNGIIVNLFYADTVENAKIALDIGVDCILSNNYLEVYNAIKDRLGRKC